MMRLFKGLFVLLLVLIVLVVGSVAVAIVTIDPNDFKPQITKQVHKLTGRTLALEGDIGWSFFPWLGLNLGRASLSNAPGFGNEPFARIEEVDVRIKLLPLLKKQLQARKILVRGMSLNLEKDRHGKDNWSDLANATGKNEPAPSSSHTAVPADIEIRIGGIQIEDAHLAYRDAQAGTELQIDPLNLSTGAIELGKPVTVDADWVLQQQDMKVAARLEGQLTVDPAHGVYRATGLTLHSNIRGAGFPDDGIEAEQSMNLAANTQTQVLTVDALHATLGGLTLSGNLKVDHFIDKPNLNGHFRSNEFSPRSLMQSLGLTPPATAGEALEKASLEFDLQGDPSAIGLHALKVTLDDSTLTGQFTLSDLARQAMRFELHLDQIDIDRYLPPAGATSDTAQASPASDRIELPLALLRKLDIDGQAEIGKLTASKLLFENARVSLKANNGKLRLAPLRAEAYGGKATITAGLDVHGKTPVYHADIDLAGVQSAGILETLFGDRYLSGKASFKAKVSSRGETISGLQKNLGGQFHTEFRDGTIKGSKLSKKINEARNFWRKLKGKPPVTEDIGDNTHFSSLTATGQISNGVIVNKDLKILAPIFQAKGEGRVDLPNRFIDYKLYLADKAGEGVQRTFVPLQIKGPFANLSFKLRVDSVLKERANARLEAEKAKLKARAQAEQEKLKARLEAEKAAKKAELEARAEKEKAKLKEKAEEKKKQLEEKLKHQLKDKFKKLF